MVLLDWNGHGWADSLLQQQVEDLEKLAPQLWLDF